jgi:hypothetical protein
MTDLLGIGRRHWRSFMPIWLFPIVFLLTVALPGFSSHAGQYFRFLDFPTLLICGYVALKPWRVGGIRFAQMFFWFAVVPFLIWTLLIFGIFGAAGTFGLLHR